ncbi:MAG: hypothetical protein WCU74_01025 [Candidatus Omnitrophota bacterium]
MSLRPGTHHNSDHGKRYGSIAEAFVFQIPFGKAQQLPLFEAMHRLFGRAEALARAGFNLDKNNPARFLADGVDFSDQNPVVFFENLVPLDLLPDRARRKIIINDKYRFTCCHSNPEARLCD